VSDNDPATPPETASDALEASEAAQEAAASVQDSPAREGAADAENGPQQAPETAQAEPDGTVEDDADDEGLGAPTLESALEALLLVTDEPLDVPTLASVVRRPTGEVQAALHGLAAGYDEQGRGFELREVAGGWRYYTRADCSAVVERYVRDGQTARLTQAALETLAVIAYRQPVSRARVSAVRGVNVDGVIRTLHSRGLIAEAGHDPTSQAILYRTTELFLERLGITSLEDLPSLADYLPDIELLDALADEM
jgi:segregation and condensation protein B